MERGPVRLDQTAEGQLVARACGLQEALLVDDYMA
jgi:hypothetical protein